MMNTMRRSDSRATLAARLTLVKLACVAAMLIASAASAQPAGGPPQGPPPEALAACKSLASDATCGFSGPRGAQPHRTHRTTSASLSLSASLHDVH